MDSSIFVFSLKKKGERNNEKIKHYKFHQKHTIYTVKT